ncbi:MAG: TfuA-related McrA-glycine thioamidation protein [Euryarchaeota archaeon]|nr:TfuA-related McrA-glycine thioamidation protein [Euryarchaeota archaeon]
MSDTRTRAVVFTGTSISHSDASQVLDATYRPPVRRGDVTKVTGQGFDIIGIIDGVFFDRAAVAHREILSAMKKGIAVVGGCSMGALRASELDRHGMIGVGQIYEWYRDGVLEADDEVAVTTNPETHEPVSTPMVNIRQTLNAAQAAGLIDPPATQRLLGIAQHTHYPQRSYLGIIKDATNADILSSRDADALAMFCKDHEVDIKQTDAIAVLEKIKQLLGND